MMPGPPRSLLPGLLLTLVISSAASAGERTASRSKCVVLERGDGQSPVIAARINESGPFALVLDTGSSGTTLDDRRIKQLGLAPAGAEQAQGMGGSIDVDLFRLRSFESGPLAAQNLIVPRVPAPSFESHDIAGLAGVDLFGQTLAIWRLDQSCVQLAASGSRPKGRGWRTTPSRWLKPWKVLLPVRIGKASGWGLVDTGAQKTILSPGFARVARLGDAIPQRRSTITGVEGRAAALLTYAVPNAAVGDWRFKRTTVSVAALPLFDRLGGMNEPVAIIGMDWIAAKPFAIDYGRQQVWQQSLQGNVRR